MTSADPPAEVWHASCVAIDGRAVLITGPSGAGKSALALQLMAGGAQLVADDRVLLTRDADQIIATCPPALRGLIEARGVGILRADPLERAMVVLVVDMAQTEAARLPPQRHVICIGLSVDLAHCSPSSHFPAAILQYLRMGRHA